MALKTREIVWIVFVFVLAISVLQTDAARRRRSTYRSSSSSSGGGDGGGGWIGGVVVGAIAVVFIIVVVIRYVWAKKTGMPFWGGNKRVAAVRDIRDESTVVTTTSQPYGQVIPPPPAYSNPAYPPQTDPAYPPQKY